MWRGCSTADPMASDSQNSIASHTSFVCKLCPLDLALGRRGALGTSSLQSMQVTSIQIICSAAWHRPCHLLSVFSYLWYSSMIAPLVFLNFPSFPLVSCWWISSALEQWRDWTCSRSCCCYQRNDSGDYTSLEGLRTSSDGSFGYSYVGIRGHQDETVSYLHYYIIW